MRDVNSGIDGAVRALVAQAEPRDRAAHLLALRLALAIEESDDPTVLRDLAPRLLSALDAIHATPKSRVAPKQTQETTNGPASALSQLRAAHAQGL